MESYPIPHTDLEVSRLAYGCMQLGGWKSGPVSEKEKRAALSVVMTAYELGINLFDHADIYGYGRSEEVFSAVWREIPREEVVIQSKCGIILEGDPRYEGPGRYDLSYQHIVRSVEGSLQRLETEYLDILLLHRPDPLVQPEAVGQAFDELERSGKVRYFGVSNHSAWQIELLQAYLDQPLVVNQLELNLLHHHLIAEGIVVNVAGGVDARATGLLDYCRLNEIFVQAWSPVAGGRLFDAGDSGERRALAGLIARLAEEKGTTQEAIALAWLLRHPSGIQPVIGTTRPERLEASAIADEVHLTREEWYALLSAARGAPVP